MFLLESWFGGDGFIPLRPVSTSAGRTNRLGLAYNLSTDPDLFGVISCGTEVTDPKFFVKRKERFLHYSCEWKKVAQFGD